MKRWREQGRCARPMKAAGDNDIIHLFGEKSVMGFYRCSKTSIRKAYHKFSLLYHPDKAKKNGFTRKCAEDNFLDMQKAYERAKQLC